MAALSQKVLLVVGQKRYHELDLNVATEKDLRKIENVLSFSLKKSIITDENL